MPDSGRPQVEPSRSCYATVAELRRAIIIEMLVAAGLPRAGWQQTAFAPLAWPPAHRFARLAASADRLVAQRGIAAGARWLLSRFVTQVSAVGLANVPAEGPLVVASNHPGSYDVMAITSLLNRDDLKLIVSDVPFMHRLYGASAHIIPASHDPRHRMAAFREGVRHLHTGGALLIFASAQVDPDPALRPGAGEALGQWSASLPRFLRQAPDTQLLVTIVSGVVARSCYNHPLARLRPNDRLRQFSAEFLQIGQQVLFGRRFGLTPTVHFGPPATVDDLGGVDDPQAAQTAIVARARQLLASAQLTDPSLSC